MTNPWPAVERSGPQGAKVPTQRLVSPSEGKRSAAKGTQGVAPRHSTVEAGELAPEEPVEGRARPTGGSRGGKQREHFEAPHFVTVTPRVSVRGVHPASRRLSGCIANPLVDEPDALIAHVRICGSCGE